MGDLITGMDPSGGEGKISFDTAHIADVKAWLNSTFDAADREVPEFEYTPRTVAHLHAIATVSQARTQAATIVAGDLRQKASEYRSQAARLREILDSAGLAHENLSANAVTSSQMLASVSNQLNIKDTEMSSFLVAMGDLSLRKTDVEEKRASAQKESKILLENTRKAIARLTYLKRTLTQLEEEIAGREGPMVQWQTNLRIMVSKERQYLQQLSNYKALLSRVGYTPEISHGVLMQMVENRNELERKTKPLLDTLRSYQDLPPDKALAALAIEDKRREYAAAEKYLEEALHSALNTPSE